MNEMCFEPMSTQLWAGLDVSKRTFDAALIPVQFKAMPYPLSKFRAREFARTEKGVKDFIGWLDKQLAQYEQVYCVRCVMEATGRYSKQLAMWIIEQRPSLGPAIAPPHQTAAFIKSLGVRNSTDKLAARCLALYGLQRQPKPYEPPSPEQQALQDLSRYRDSLVCQHTSAKNQASEITSSSFVQRNRCKRLRLLESDIKRVEKELRQLVNSGEPPQARPRRPNYARNWVLRSRPTMFAWVSYLEGWSGLGRMWNCYAVFTGLALLRLRWSWRNWGTFGVLVGRVNLVLMQD